MFLHHLIQQWAGIESKTNISSLLLLKWSSIVLSQAQCGEVKLVK